MLPSFITKHLASKVLLIGKSINFIRQTCRNRGFAMDDTQSVRNLDQAAARSVLGQANVLASTIDSVYHMVSRRLLEVFFGEFRFREHLAAMRRYMLLGQGDFTRHLMDLME